MYYHSQRLQKALELQGCPTLHEVLVPPQVHGHRWALLHPKNKQSHKSKILKIQKMHHCRYSEWVGNITINMAALASPTLQ